MTKSEAIYRFFSGFGIDAYPNTYVPEEKVFPWITYENKIGNAGDVVYITASLWYHTESEKTPNDKAEQIATKIGRGGIQIPCDDGMIWIKRGNPWLNSIPESDASIKHKKLNIILEFM